MKTKYVILILFFAILGLLQACQKEESQILANSNVINESAIISDSDESKSNFRNNLKSNNDYQYYDNTTNEYSEKLNFLTDSLGFNDQTLLGEINANNSLLQVDLNYKGEVNIFKTNNSFVSFLSNGDKFLIIDTIKQVNSIIPRQIRTIS